MLGELISKFKSTGLTPKSNVSTQKPKNFTDFTPVSRKRKRRNRRTVVDKSQVLILSDSHGRHCSRLLGEELGPRFDCTGIVKHGAPLWEVVKEAPAFAAESDTAIIIGRTNDVIGYTYIRVPGVYFPRRI
jgi:hypothetical protein